jgi:sporulation protein YlmC with PRC-barrel domain
MTRKFRVVPRNDDASVLPGMLLHLRDMKGFVIADPVPDIRGWEVMLRDARRVGRVDDVIVDTKDLEAKYLEVKVDHEVMGASEDSWVLVPISAAHIRDKDDRVVIDWLPVSGIAGAPRSSGKTPTPNEEGAIHQYFTPRRRSGEDESLDKANSWERRNAARKGAPESSGGRT